MKIGIIGPNSFIGSNLIRYFNNKKKCDVFVFSSYSKFKKKWINKVCSEISKNKPNIIINCSAYQNLNYYKKNIAKLLESNISANIFFMYEATKNKKFNGFITFGTKYEFNDKYQYQPSNFYAATKHCTDFFLKYFSIKKKISTVSLKLFDTYGNNDKRKKILNLLIKAYKKNKTLNLTPGDQYLDLVNIKDICSLIELICTDIKKRKLLGHNVFTVSSLKPIKLKKLVYKINKRLKKKIKVKFNKIRYRSDQPLFKMKKYSNYPNWKISVDLISELKKLFDK